MVPLFEVKSDVLSFYFFDLIPAFGPSDPSSDESEKGSNNYFFPASPSDSSAGGIEGAVKANMLAQSALHSNLFTGVNHAL